MSFKATSWAVEQFPRSGTHKLVLLILSDWADPEGLAYPKQRTLAVKAMLSERTIRSVLADLEEDQFIARTSTRRKDGRRGTDQIRLNLKLGESVFT